MKTVLLVAALIVAAVVPGIAQQPAPHEAEFRAFYNDFLAAARANNKAKIADLIAFPVDDWSVETKGDVQTGKIKDRADFIARYNSLFTASMRAHIPKAKLQMLKDGRYILVWHDADAEFGFEFGYSDGTGYRVRSYTIGPR
jgi:hypothetical protein